MLLLWALLLGLGLMTLAATLWVSAAISQAAWAKSEEAQLARALAGFWQAAADLFQASWMPASAPSGALEAALPAGPSRAPAFGEQLAHVVGQAAVGKLAGWSLVEAAQAVATRAWAR